MSKLYYFFKNILKYILDENTFSTLWDFLDYWIFKNAWIPILFMIFLGVSFEIIFIRICEYLKKKLELWENASSDSQKSEDSFPRSLTFGLRSWSLTCSSSEEKVERFSETITSTPTSEETGVRTFSSDECEYQESHFSESPSASIGTSPSLSLFHSEEKNIYISHTKDPVSECQTIQFSSKNLFSIMKTNRKKKTRFSDDLSFQKAFKCTARDEDLNVTPCPLVHLFLSSDQIKLVEENVKCKILSKSKATLGRDANYPCPRSQEPLTQNQPADEMVIPAQVQDSFPEENAMQNQRFHEAQFASQTQQHIHYQESVGSLPDFTQPPDLEAQFPSQTQQCIYNEKSVIGQPDFPEPPDLMRTPFSRSIQDSFQAEDVDESQHCIKVPLFETQDLIKDIEVDDHFSETQYCIYSEDSNNIKYPIEGQNNVVKNAEFLASSLNSDSFAEDKPQQKSIMPQIQQAISSSELNQFSTNSSTSLSPIIKEQRNRRKIPDRERKLGLKVSSLKAKKTSNLQVILMTVCHTSNEKIEFGCKKKILPQKKMPQTALYLTSSVSKLNTPHIKNHLMKNLVTVMTDVIKHECFLQKQTRSPDTEEICDGISAEGETSRSVENVQQSFRVNTDEPAAPCSLSETNRESKEPSKDSVEQTFDLNVPKYEMLSEEVISESMQKRISSLQIESSQGMKIHMDLRNAENVEELIMSTANTQRYSSKENTDNAKDSVEIVLKFSGINLLISLEPKKHERNELKSMKIQVKRGSIEEEKPLILDIAEYNNPSESEKLDCNKRDTHRDKGTSDIVHNAMPTSISEPLDIDLQSELKTKTGTSTVTSYSHSALKQEKLLDEKKTRPVKYTATSTLKKPQECEREEEEGNEEAVPQLTEDFRFHTHLKQKDQCVPFQMELSRSGNRKIQDKEQERLLQTSSTQTVWEHSLCFVTDSLQAEKMKQNTEKPPGRERATDPVSSLSMPENLRVGKNLIETEHGVPFGENPTKTWDSHSEEEKEGLKRDLDAVAMGPFKRKRLSGTKNVLSVRHKITKAKKPAVSLKLCISAHNIPNHVKTLENGLKVIIEQTLRAEMLASVFLNAHPHRSSIPVNKTYVRKEQKKSKMEKEKEKTLDSLNEGNESPGTLDLNLCRDVKAVRQGLPEAAAHTRNFGLDAHPTKEIKTEKEIYQTVSFTKTIEESGDLQRMDSFHDADTKRSIWMETGFQRSAELEMGPRISERLSVGDSLNPRESDVPSNKNETRKILYGSTLKRKLSKDLLVAFSRTFNYCVPISICSKKKKDRVKFTNMNTVRLKCTNKVKPSVSKILNIAGNRKKSKLNSKNTLKKKNHAKAFSGKCQNSLSSPLHSRFHQTVCHPQLTQEEPAIKTHIDFSAGSSVFYNREKKLGEKKQKAFAKAASQHSQELWSDADDMKETHLDELGPSLFSLTQEQPVNGQDVQHRKGSAQTALGGSLKMDPPERGDLQKTSMENGKKVPVDPKILPPEAEGSSLDDFVDAETDDDLELDENSERDLNLYPEEKQSDMSTNLQVTFLQSSDSSTMPFFSRPKKQKRVPVSKKLTPVSQRRRTNVKALVSQIVNLRSREKPKHNKEIKDLQQSKSIADAVVDVIRSKVPTFPNERMRNLKAWRDKQRIGRCGLMQLKQEKIKRRNIYCPSCVDMGSSSNTIPYYGEEEEEEPEALQSPGDSPRLLFSTYQEKDSELVKPDEELSEPGRTMVQVQPPTALTETISCCTSCPIPDQFHSETLESCYSYPPLMSVEAKDDAFSEREDDILTDERCHKEKAGGGRRGEPSSVSCGDPNHWEEMERDSAEIEDIYQDKKDLDKMYSLTPDSDIDRRMEIETGTAREKTLSSILTKQKIPLHEGCVTSEAIKETDLQDKEDQESDGDDDEEDNTLFKSLPQYSQHFVFCSSQSKDLNPCKSRNQSRNTLYVIEQNVPQQSQSAYPTEREEPGKSLQTQGDTHISSSKLPPLKSEESQIDEITVDETKCDIPADGIHIGELNSWGKLERVELRNNLQATVPLSLNLSTPDLSASKRQSKVTRCRVLQSKMSPTCRVRNGRKAPISTVLTIPQHGCRKKLPPKASKSQIFELLIYSDILSNKINMILSEDPGAERNKRLLTQESAATRPESPDFSTLGSPIAKENLELMDKELEINPSSLALKAKEAPIAQTLTTAGRDTPNHRKQLKCRSETETEQGEPVADPSLNAISSPVLVSLDIKTCDRIKEMTGKTKSSPEPHDQSVHEETTWCTPSIEKATSDHAEDVSDNEEDPLTSQNFNFGAQKMTEPTYMKSDLKLMNSATHPELEKPPQQGPARAEVSNTQSSKGGLKAPSFLTGIVSSIARHLASIEDLKNRLGSQRVPNISAARGISSQVKQSTASRSLKGVDLAAVNIKEEFKAPTIKGDNYILNADILNGDNIQHQNSFHLRKHGENIFLKASLDLRCIRSPIQKFTEVKLDKEKLEERENIPPQLDLEKPSNKKQMSSHADVSTGTLKGNGKEERDHQYSLEDIHQPYTQPFRVRSQQTKEHHPRKLEDLRRRVYSKPALQKGDIPGSRGGTEACSDWQEVLQQKSPLEQETWKPDMILESSLGSASFPTKELPPLKMVKECITKQAKPPSLQRTKGLKAANNLLDSKEASLSRRLLMPQQPNLLTEPPLESVSSHVPPQSHSQKPKEDIKRKNKPLVDLTQQLVKEMSNEAYISEMDHTPRSVEKLLLLIKEQEKKRRKIRKAPKLKVSVDIKTTVNPSLVPNYSPPRAQFIDTIEKSGVFEQRDGTEPNRNMTTLWRQQKFCVHGISLDYVYAGELGSSHIIEHKNKGRMAPVESVLYPKRMKMKVRKATAFQMLNITGYRTHSHKKELRQSIKKQELLQRKNVESQIKKIIEERKDEPQEQTHILPQLKLKKSLSETKTLSVQPIHRHAMLSTIRRPAQYIMKQKEHQVVLLDVLSQNRDQLMVDQQAEETQHIDLNASLGKEAYRVVFPENRRTSDTSRLRTKPEYLPAQRLPQELVIDSISIPPGRKGSEKMSISSSSKGQNIFLIEMDTFQQKTHKVQELLKQESTSMANSGSVACPVRESFHLQSTEVIAKKGDVYNNGKSIPHILGRKELKEADTVLDPNAQMFLCTNLEDTCKMDAGQRGLKKSGHRPRISLDSIPCHKRAPLHLINTLNKRGKSDSSSISDEGDPRGKAQSELADSPLKLNRQKVKLFKKSSTEQLNAFKQSREKILGFVSSCILCQHQTENTKKQILAKATSNSEVLNLVEEKSSDEANTPVAQPSRSKGISLRIKGRKCLPEGASSTSDAPSLIDIHQIMSSHLGKTLKAVHSLDYHTLKTEKGDQKERKKRQKRHHLSISLEDLEAHISYCKNYSHAQSHVEPKTKENEVGDISRGTKGLDLSSRDQLGTACEHGPGWGFPSVTPKQMKEKNTWLPSESESKPEKYPDLLFSKIRQSPEGAQINKPVSNDTSSKIRVKKKKLPNKVSQKRQQELCLPRVLLNCLFTHMPFLHENEKQEDHIEQGVLKDMECPERTPKLKKLGLPHPFDDSARTPYSEQELQYHMDGKMIHIKCRMGKPGPPVMKTCEPMRLPHFKLDTEKTDVLVLNSEEREKPKSQEEMEGTVDSNVTLKTEESPPSASPQSPFSEKKLPLLFDTAKQQDEVQKGTRQPDVKPMTPLISLPPRLHPHSDFTKAGKEKSGPPKNYLIPLKPLLPLQFQKVPFAETFNSDAFYSIIELKHLPQMKKIKSNIADVKDIMGLRHMALQGKKSPFKHLLHGMEPWSNNNNQKTTLGSENNLDVVQNKSWDSSPPSPDTKWDPKTTEEYLKDITRFCLQSALRKLSGTANDILSSIKKAKYMPPKDRLQTASEEMMYFQRLVLRKEQSSVSQQSLFNVEEKEKKLQENKQVKNQRKPSISSLPYSVVETRIYGKEAMQIKTGSSHLQSKLQESSENIREITYERSTCEPVLNSMKLSIIHAIQREESIKIEKIIPPKGKIQQVSQKIQLDTKDQEKELQKIKDEPNVAGTNTSSWLPSPPCLDSNTRIETANNAPEVAIYSLPELPHQKSSDTLRRLSQEWIESNIPSGAQSGKDQMPQKTEDEVKAFAEKVSLHTKDKDWKGNRTPPQDLLSSPKAQGKIDPQNKEQEKTDGKGREWEKCVCGGKTDPDYTKQEKCHQGSKKQGKMDPEGHMPRDIDTGSKEQGKAEGEAKEQEEREAEHKEHREADGSCPEQEKVGTGGKEQQTWNHRCKDQGRGGKSEENVSPRERFPSRSSHLQLDIRIEEDILGIIKSAISQLQYQKLFDSGKIKHTKSTEVCKKSSDIRTVEQREPQTCLDKGKNVNMKDVTDPKDTSCSTDELLLSHVPPVTGLHGPNSTEEQKNVSENWGYVQERKSKLNEVLSLTSLSHSKLDQEIKVKEGTLGVTGSFSSNSWNMEASDTEKLNYAVSPLNNIARDSKSSRYISHKEEDRANTFETNTMRPKATAVKRKKAPLLGTLKTMKLQVNMKEESKKPRDTKDRVLPLSKTHPFSMSVDISKLETTEDVESEIIQNDIPFPEPQESLPAEQVASIEPAVDDTRKRKRYLSQEEEVHALTMNASTQPCGQVFKAKISVPLLVYTVSKRSILNKRKTPQRSSKEKARQKQKRDSNVVPTKSDASVPLVPQHKLSRLQYEFLMTSDAGKTIYAFSNEGFTSPNVILKSDQQKPHEDAKDSIKKEDPEERLTLKTRTSPHTHLDDRKTLKEVQEENSQPGMVLKETTSWPSPCFLKPDTRVNEKDSMLGGTQFPFTPPKTQDTSESDEKPFTELSNDGVLESPNDHVLESPDSCVLESSRGWMLSNKKEPTQSAIQEKEKYMRDKKSSKLTDLKVKKLLLSHMFPIKEVQGKNKKQNLVDTRHAAVELSTSQFQLSKSSDTEVTDRGRGSDEKELKEHVPQKEKEDREKLVSVNSVMEATDINVKTKQSSIIHTRNLSDLQWKSREQEEKAEEDKSEPGIMLSEPSEAVSSRPFLTVSSTTKEETTLTLTSSFVSTENSPKLSDSEQGTYTLPVTGGDIVISLGNGKEPVSCKQKENTEHILKVTAALKYQEIKMQELEDEPRLVLRKSPLLSYVLHPKLDEKTELDNIKLRLRNSALQNISSDGETVPRESIIGEVTKDISKQRLPQKEETDREERVDKRGTDVTLKSLKSPPSQKLCKSQLHMHIKRPKPKEHEDSQGQQRVLRKIYTSELSPRCVSLDKCIQVDEERPESQPSSSVPALSDAEKMADTKAVSSGVKRREQCTPQFKNTVDLTVGVPHKRAKISPTSHLLNSKEFVLHMNVLEEKQDKDGGEPAVVAKMTFLPIPPAPISSPESQDKTEKNTAKITGSSYPQKNLQELSDAQETANKESFEGVSKNIKGTEPCVPQREARPRKLESMIRAQQITEHPQVKSVRELSPQDGQADFTRLSIIRKEKMPDMFFKGQNDQPENNEKELSTEIETQKKKSEIENSLNHTLRPKFSISPLEKFKETDVTGGTSLCSKGFYVMERVARQPETSSKVSVESLGSWKFDKPKKNTQSNVSVNEMFCPSVLTLKRLLEKIGITKLSTSQNKEQNVTVKMQVMKQTKSGHQTEPNSFLSLDFPIHNRNQSIPLQTDVDQKTTGTTSLGPGVHVSTTEFNATRRKDPSLLVSEQDECDVESFQKFHSPLLKSGHMAAKDEADISSVVNLKLNKLETSNSSVNQEEGELETDTSRTVYLEEDEREMQSCTVSLEKLRRDPSSPTNHAFSPTAESQTKTQAITDMENSVQQKLKKDLELSYAKQILQGQKLFQTNVLDSFFVYIPIARKRQKRRFTKTNLKRKLKPKYLTMRIPKYPVSRILGIKRHSSPSNRRMIENAFKKPKTMVPGSKDASRAVIGHLCVSPMTPFYAELEASKTNLGSVKQIYLSKSQEKSPDGCETKDMLNMKELNFVIPVPHDSQAFVVNDQQVQMLPQIRSEANLEDEASETNISPHMREQIIPGNNDLKATENLDVYAVEQEEIPKFIPAPSECPLKLEGAEYIVETQMERTVSANGPAPVVEPLLGLQLFDAREGPLFSTKKEATPGTVSIPPQVRCNENKTLVECLFPIYETLRRVFEAPVENKIQAKVPSYKLEETQTNKPDNGESSPFPESPDTPSKMYAILLRTPLLKHLTPESRNKLTMHLDSKASEINLNQIPEMVNTSLEKFSSYPKGLISEDNSWNLYAGHKKINFMTLKVDTREAHLNHSYQRAFPSPSCMRTPSSDVSCRPKGLVIEPEGISKQGGVTSPTTPTDGVLSTHVLQKFSEREREHLIMHLSVKTLEIQTASFPRIVAEYCIKASAPDQPKPVFKCIHSATKGPIRTNRILIIFDEKSFCEIDHDLQSKYLRSVSKSPVDMFPKPNVLPNHTPILSPCLVHKKVDDGKEDHTHSFDKEPLQYVNKNENILPSRKFQEPTLMPAFDPDLQGMDQKDSKVRSELRSHVTPEKYKQCCVWFQETNSHKYSASRARENATDLADSHSSWISDEWTDIPLYTKSSTNLEEHQAPEKSDSEECVFIETNFYLTLDSQKSLLKVPKGIPLADLKAEEASCFAPLYSKDPSVHHSKTHGKQTSSVIPPSCESQKRRKYRSSSKTQSPDWLSHSSSNTVEIRSTSSSTSFSEGKCSWTTWSKTSYSLTSTTTESRIRSHHSKDHEKSPMHPEVKERRKATSDSHRKYSVHWSTEYGHIHSEEKHVKKKKVYNYQPKRSDYIHSDHSPASKAPQESMNFSSERREYQPFFYACVPADSMDTVPKTIRWVIPPKILQKRNFQVPRVANISKSWNLWNSSKKFWGSLAEVFHSVRQG